VRVRHQEGALLRQTCRRYPEFSYARFRRGDGAVDVKITLPAMIE